MTAAEMVRRLRALGYRVQLPADLREAGPWRCGPDDFSRVWVGATKLAVLVRRDGLTHRPDKHPECRERRCDCEWAWRATLMGRGSGRRDGKAATPMDAQVAADQALLEMMEDFRRRRHAAAQDAPLTGAGLSLPLEDT